MNVALRKLAMLEKKFEVQEERAKLQGYFTSPVDNEMKRNVTELMDKVRTL